MLHHRQVHEHASRTSAGQCCETLPALEALLEVLLGHVCQGPLACPQLHVHCSYVCNHGLADLQEQGLPGRSHLHDHACMTPAHACCVDAVKTEDSGRQYKTFRGLQAPDLEPPQYRDQAGRTIHLWLGSSTLTSVSCHRNPDGSYSGTLALRTGGAPRLGRHCRACLSLICHLVRWLACIGG